MAKGLGLIGNFRGKFGNAVGYNLKDSNNKQTQGIRIYQPIVKNPKTYAQAEQRAKLAPINATYRLLKSVIDRGQEAQSYGNKSRLAWLRDAIKSYDGMWTEKGAAVKYPALLPLTKGSLPLPLTLSPGAGEVHFAVTDLTASDTPSIADVSTKIIAQYPSIKEGDQITVVAMGGEADYGKIIVCSFIVDSTSTGNLNAPWQAFANKLAVNTGEFESAATAIILSREGDNGQHLRSSSAITKTGEYPSPTSIAASKQAAIQSYMAAGSSTDWPEVPED